MAEELKAEDLRIDTYYAGEHSGFLHTDQTAVRITHLPTGVFVESKDERSVHANKQRCLDLLPESIASMNTRAQLPSQAAPKGVVMARIKTDALKGAALDWAVAKCEGHSLPPFPGRGQTRGPKECWINVSPSSHETFSPSTDWGRGGPIIEREHIWLTHHVAAKMHGAHKGDDVRFQKGPTPLIAAMRCYVASKLGDELDVPAELCE